MQLEKRRYPVEEHLRQPRGTSSLGARGSRRSDGRWQEARGYQAARLVVAANDLWHDGEQPPGLGRVNETSARQAFAPARTVYSGGLLRGHWTSNPNYPLLNG